MANEYEQILHRLGGKPSYQTDVKERRKSSEAQLERMEKDIGFSLPSDYREFLRDCGGCVFPAAVEFPLLYNQDDVRVSGLDILFDFDPSEAQSMDYYYGDLLSQGDMWEFATILGAKLVKNFPDDIENISWPPELLPIGVNAGGNWICLALAGLRKGFVFFWVDNGNYGENVYVVANSFDEFIHSLRKSDE